MLDVRHLCSNFIYLCPAVAVTHGSLFDVPISCGLFQWQPARKEAGTGEMEITLHLSAWP